MLYINGLAIANASPLVVYNTMDSVLVEIGHNMLWIPVDFATFLSRDVLAPVVRTGPDPNLIGRLLRSRRYKEHGTYLPGIAAMIAGWILLGLVVWALLGAFTLFLFRVSQDQDRLARHQELDLIPHSDVTVTQFGI
jgi:hypothetical protein